MPVTITCLHCGKTIDVYPSQANQRFCSKTCRFAHETPRVQKVCVICGQPFENRASRAKEQVTCRSEECKKAIKFGKHNPFYGREHSDASKKKVSKAKTLPRTEVLCTCGCGELLQIPGYKIRLSKTSMFFADAEHMRSWMEGEHHWNYRGGDVYYGDGWKKVAQAVRDRDKVCQHCGKTPEENGRALDVHHINPVRVSRDNSMENLIALCMSCHHRINVFEQYDHPYKVSKYRKCIACDKLFVPKPFQRFCSPECQRKRKRQYEKTYRDSHPEYVQRRYQHIRQWQQAHPEKLQEYSRRGHQRQRQKRQNQERPA